MSKPCPEEAKIIRKWNSPHWTYLTIRVGKNGSNYFLSLNGKKPFGKDRSLRPQINKWDKKFLTKARRRQSIKTIQEEIDAG